MGVPVDSKLYRTIGMDQRAVALPDSGVVLTEKLAEILGVEVGNSVSIEVLEGSRALKSAIVRDVVKSFSGAGVAYMEINALNGMMQEGPNVSGAFLSVDAARAQQVFRALKEMPRVASVTSQRAARDSFREIISQNLLRMRIFNIVFASVIAFGVVYNCARITLSEQSRDLATLRVIGLTRREISAILLGEIGAITAAAVPLGLGLGYGLAALAVWALETDTQQFPLVVRPATYSFAATVTLVATLLSSLVVRRRLDKLDLLAVLKSRE
jgi:putative ABC transport system permease protein